MFGSQTEYARHVGVTKQAVSKWAKRGVVVFADDGQVDFLASDDKRRQHAHPARNRGGRPAGSEPTGFAEAKARREHYQALQAEIAYRQQIGRLVDRQAVIEAQGEVARSVRRDLDRLTLQADALTAAAREGGVPAVRARLAELVRAVQEDIAARLERLIQDRVDPAGDWSAEASEPDASDA